MYFDNLPRETQIEFYNIRKACTTYEQWLLSVLRIFSDFPSVTREIWIQDETGEKDMWDPERGAMILTVKPLSDADRATYAKHYFAYRESFGQLLINKVIEKIKACTDEIEKAELIDSELKHIENECSRSAEINHGVIWQAKKELPGIKHLDDDGLLNVAYGIGLHKLKVFLLRERCSKPDTNSYVNSGLTNPADEKTVEQDTPRNSVEKHFKPFTGFRKPGREQPIMNDKEYSRLIDYTVFYLSNNRQAPANVSPVRIDVPRKEFIFYTFYKLFEELEEKYSLTANGFIELMRAINKDAANWQVKSLYRKWSQPPPYYQHDREKFINNAG